MRVRWTKPALEDLDDIENYIALDDAGRAADFVDKLIDLGESLEFMRYRFMKYIIVQK